MWQTFATNNIDTFASCRKYEYMHIAIKLGHIILIVYSDPKDYINYKIMYN